MMPIFLLMDFNPVTTPSIEATLDISNNGASDFIIKSSDNVKMIQQLY